MAVGYSVMNPGVDFGIERGGFLSILWAVLVRREDDEVPAGVRTEGLNRDYGDLDEEPSWRWPRVMLLDFSKAIRTGSRVHTTARRASG